MILNKKTIYFLLALLAMQLFILFSVLKGYDFQTAAKESPRNIKAQQVKQVYENTAHTAVLSSVTLSKLTPFPGINAHAYLVKIIGDDKSLVASREWKRLPPASLTKLLTAVLVREELEQAEKIYFSQDAKNTEDKRSPVRTGGIVWRDDAIRLTLIASFNDTALALAEKIGEKHGGQTFEERLAIFLDIMNLRAGSLGLKDSLFKNPNGLDTEGHAMSANDIARLAEYIWENQRSLLDITRISHTAIRPLGDTEFAIQNTNELLQEFPALLGGKTGFTDNARGVLLLLYPIGTAGKVAVIVILGSEDRFGDGRKIIQWLETST